jgi:hypothetical protein
MYVVPTLRQPGPKTLKLRSRGIRTDMLYAAFEYACGDAEASNGNQGQRGKFSETGKGWSTWRCNVHSVCMWCAGDCREGVRVSSVCGQLCVSMSDTNILDPARLRLMS